jgi:hypothetical protein
LNSSAPVPTPDFTYAPPARKSSLLTWVLAAGAVIFLLLLWQCGSAILRARRLSNLAVWHFHTQLNSDEFEDICNEADEAFSQAEKRDELMKVLKTVHTKLGDAGEESMTSININTTMNGVFILSNYTTKFAQGTADEQFTFRKDGQSVKLYSYHVNSHVLVP